VSFRDDLLGVVDLARAIPADLGLREYSIVIRTETFGSDGRTGAASSTTDVTLSPNPKVREKDNGRRLVVGPITPDHSAGGYTPAELNVVAGASAAQRITYRVTGPNGLREYVCSDINTDRGYRYILTLDEIDDRQRPV
jgi:hypothetical protein